LSPSGAYAAVGLGDGQILVFDTQSVSAPIGFKVDEADSSVDCVAIDAEDKRLAFGTFGGKAGVIELHSPSPPLWFQAPNEEQATGQVSNNQAHLGIVIDVRFSPDGQRVVTCSGIDGFTRVWQVDGKCIEALNTAGVATFARLLKDDRLVSLTEQGEIAFWSVGIRALLNHLSHRTSATLSCTERIRYLNEDSIVAYKHYCAAERSHGRTPLPRDFVKIDYR
jgi:WD40 repeat protein